MNSILASLLGMNNDNNDFLSGDYDVNSILKKPRNSIDELMMPINEDIGLGHIHDAMMGNPRIDNFVPSHTAFDRLNQLYDQMPTRDQYKPSRLRDITSRIAGLGAVGPATYYDGMALGFKGNPLEQEKIHDQMANAPYYDTMDEFGAKAKLAGDIAKLESQNNTQAENDWYRRSTDERLRQDLERKTQEGIERDKNADAERERKIAKDKSDAELAQQRVDNYRQRTAVQEWKAKNPNHVMKTDEQDRIIAINPQTNEAVYVLDPATGEPIKSSTLSDEQKINLGLKASLAKIAATGAEQRKTEEVKAGNQQAAIVARGDQQRQTNANRTTTGRTQSVGQKLQAFKINHPEWVTYLNKDGSVMPAKTGHFGSGPDQDTYNKINSALKMEVTGVNLNQPTDEKVVVEDKAGKRYSLPKSQLSDALKQGYKEVR